MVRLRLRRSSTASVGTEQCVSEKAKAVLQIVRSKGPPLTLKEVDYCDEACIGRILKAKGNQVKKAARQLRATLSWRASLDVDYLTADEFSAEIASGCGFVAGHDEHDKPVLVVRLKPENLSNQAQKQFLRYMVFCMEVAIGCMPSTVEQCVLILDACCLKNGSPGMSVIVHLLKVIGEHYPERLARTFIVDAPPMFYYLWKGIGKFLDLKMREKLRFVFSRDYNNSEATSMTNLAANHTVKGIRSYSNRNLWAGEEQQSDREEEQQKDNQLNGKPQTLPASTPSINSTLLSSFLPSLSSVPLTSPLTSSSTSSSSMPSVTSSSSSSTSSSSSSTSVMPLSFFLPSLHRPSGGPALLSDKSQARSFSFASALTFRKEETTEFRSFRVDTRPSRRVREEGSSRRWTDLTFGFKKEDHTSNQTDAFHKDKSLTLFKPYYKAFVSMPYSEAAYRAYMKPALAGLISILASDLKLRQPSFSMQTTSMEAMLHHLHLE